MLTQSEHDTIVAKTKELCATIIAQPGMAGVRQRVDAFLADEAARDQYERVVSRGEELRRRQHAGEPISQAEAEAFRAQQDDLAGNAVASSFFDAQQQLRQVHQSVSAYVTKTLELGRVPTDDDFESSGCCGHEGCGCGH